MDYEIHGKKLRITYISAFLCNFAEDHTASCKLMQTFAGIGNVTAIVSKNKHNYSLCSLPANG